jgi:hypothetical protein
MKKNWLISYASNIMPKANPSTITSLKIGKKMPHQMTASNLRVNGEYQARIPTSFQPVAPPIS